MPDDHHDADVEEPKRGPGRPRKWVDDAERMRAYRARVAHERAVVKAGGTYVEMAEQIAEVTRQRDSNWAQVLRLQDQIAALERDQTQPRPVPRRAGFDNPDDAAEAAFETHAASHHVVEHTERDTKIDRLENEPHDARRLTAATNTPAPTDTPAMSRQQRRQAERKAKQRQRRT